MDNEQELSEACDLIEQLLGMSCLEDMIKDLKKIKLAAKPDFASFLATCDNGFSHCIALRGQAKDFMEKHAKQEDESIDEACANYVPYREGDK